MHIIHRAYPPQQWKSVLHMVNLAAELLEAEVIYVGVDEFPTLRAKFFSGLGRPTGDEDCLVIANGAADLNALHAVPGWRKRYRRVVAWIIDSYWTEHIPRSIQVTRPFDHLFVATPEDIPEWTRLTRTPATFLPLGSDVLRFGSGNVDRPWDLLRVGRQPPEWDSDEETAAACREAGLTFHGRPEFRDDPTEGQRDLLRSYSECKIVLAFSHLASPTKYTHPTRDYMTTRWFDAVAGGTIVAGITPKADVAREVFWPECLLELGTVDRAEGLRIIKRAAEDWRPEQAVENHRRALRRVDWRWRFAEIARTLGLTPGPLAAEIRLLERAAAG